MTNTSPEVALLTYHIFHLTLEVLDDFNNLKVTTQPPAPISNRPATIAGAAGSSDPVSAEDFDEEAFLKQLEADMMANLMDGNGIDDLGDKPGLNAGLPDAFDPASPGTREAIAKEIEQLSKELTTNGLESDEFLKTLLETFPMSGGNGKGASANPTTKSPGVESSSTGGEGSQGRDKFQDTIERTIERIQESGDRATAATAEDDIPSEIWEKLFKAVQVSAGGDDTEIRNLFMGMMEQMSNKEMLYEPMSELKAKLPSWLEENRSKGTLSAEDLVRIETQIRLVNEVVAKFDEPDYSDDKEEYRSFIWAKMQEVGGRKTLLLIPCGN